MSASALQLSFSLRREQYHWRAESNFDVVSLHDASLREVETETRLTRTPSLTRLRFPWLKTSQKLDCLRHDRLRRLL